MKIVVPASSSNLGCGFDSVGLAVNLYLEVEVVKESEKWLVDHHFGEEIPDNEDNLIVQTALKVAPFIKPHTLKINSTIPLARGLGSSSSAIVAGIELACHLGNRSLSLDEKALIACRLEGHPDNVVPAILGGLVVSSYVQESLSYCKLHLPPCAIIAFIPDYKVFTAEARKALPNTLSFGDAVHASSISNVMLSALSNGDMRKAGQMMEQDMFHEPYRAWLIPDLEKIRSIARSNGAYATYLSGAGSSIICFIENGKEDRLMGVLQYERDARVLRLTPDLVGVRVMM